MKAINNIIADIRDLAANRDWHNHTNQSNRERMLDIADRIEQAVTNCNGFKMCEALKEIWGIIKVFNRGLVSTQKTTDTIEEIIKQVLSTPPRNCDLYATVEEAYQVYLKATKDTPEKSLMSFECWLFCRSERRIV